MFLNFSFFYIILTLKEAIFGEMGAVTFGGITGYSAGFALKKIFKLVLIMAGLLFLIFQFLSHYEILTVNWISIQTFVENLLRSDHNNILSILKSHLPITGGFVVGFTLGFKKG